MTDLFPWCESDLILQYCRCTSKYCQSSAEVVPKYYRITSAVDSIQPVLCIKKLNLDQKQEIRSSTEARHLGMFVGLFSGSVAGS